VVVNPNLEVVAGGVGFSSWDAIAATISVEE
jgi:hypothetical protein